MSRTNFTRSVALMSMVGYVLGLGDRHPSNLMMERHTGKVIHIDFGDWYVIGGGGCALFGASCGGGALPRPRAASSRCCR
jgi:phosphatidylinositol kinase/protein kinase (PI-3  family)